MDIPTIEVVETLLGETTELLNLPDKEWKLIGTDNGCTVYTKKYKNYSMRLAKVSAVVKFGIENVKAELVNIEERPKWDQMCKSASRIKKVGDIDIMHIEAPQIAILSPRDVVFFTYMRADGAGGYLGVTKSVTNSEKEVPLKKDVIRVEIILSGTRLESVEVDGAPATRLTMISMVDPKGMVPKINLKPMLMKSASTIQALKEHLKKKSGGS